MIREEIINVLSYVKHHNSINLFIMVKIRYTMNEGHAKAHEQEIQVLIFGISAIWERILNIGTEFMVIWWGGCFTNKRRIDWDCEFLHWDK